MDFVDRREIEERKIKPVCNNVYMAMAGKQYCSIQHLGYDSNFQYY